MVAREGWVTSLISYPVYLRLIHPPLHVVVRAGARTMQLGILLSMVLPYLSHILLGYMGKFPYITPGTVRGP